MSRKKLWVNPNFTKELQQEMITFFSYSVRLYILHRLIFAFTIASIVQVLLSQEIVEKWVGVGSFMRGIFIGLVAGGMCPGGLLVILPIATGLLRTSATIWAIVAVLTGRSVWAVSRLPWNWGYWAVNLRQFAL